MIFLLGLVILAIILNVVVRCLDTTTSSSVDMNMHGYNPTWTGDEGWKEFFYKAHQMDEDL